MKSIDLEYLIKNFPDSFNKDPTSNLSKILEISKYSHDNYQKSQDELFESLDINNATGKTLDLYGELIGQPRGKANDEQYKLLIKTKQMQNMSNGTHPSILNALSLTFNCDPSEIHIIDGDKSASIKIVSLPLTTIIHADLSTNSTVQIIKRLLPAGIELESYLFDGTFEFSDKENEIDENTGFSDVEGGTIGGYLGVTQGDENDIMLPI